MPGHSSSAVHVSYSGEPRGRTYLDDLIPAHVAKCFMFSELTPQIQFCHRVFCEICQSSQVNDNFFAIYRRFFESALKTSLTGKRSPQPAECKSRGAMIQKAFASAGHLRAGFGRKKGSERNSP